MTARSLSFSLAVLVAALLSGCVVSSDKVPAAASWPKPLPAQRAAQFAGVFPRRSVATGPQKVTDDLLEMLTARTEPRSERLELRASPDGELLHLSIPRGKGAPQVVATLRRGVDFTFAGGALVPRQSSLGWTGGTGNVGAGLRHASFRLYPATNGGLLGHYTEGEGALLGYVIPMVDRMDTWSYWPRAAR